ncbi:ATP-binding protein [Leucobacter chromiireducens]|uniref:ATP-binding protein n=1 Tax=Leucobacter chromiireducens TaxID=283877 RepID=UPI000F63160A|nr:ATP-binding protein [Leucobacter chromiireducens]
MLQQALPRAPGGGQAFALDTGTFHGVPTPEAGLAVVSGPAGSGRTAAIRSILTALGSAPPGHPIADDSPAELRPRRSVTAALLSPHRRSALADAHPWQTKALLPSAHRALLARLTATLQRELDEGPPTAAGEFGVLVVEDIGAFAGSGIERELGAVLHRLRHSEMLAIVEGENATLNAAWELAAPLRGVRWALALRPDEHDTPAVFATPFTRMTRSGTPPGRGILVRGADVQGVHVGMPPDLRPEPPPRSTAIGTQPEAGATRLPLARTREPELPDPSRSSRRAPAQAATPAA